MEYIYHYKSLLGGITLANGGLTGYAGGLDKKLALLKLEGVDI